MNPAIEIVIEALVLEGFDPGDRDAIVSATIAELNRLMEEVSRLAPPHVQKLAAQSVHLSSPCEPRVVGAGIARAVHAALSGSRAMETT